MHRSYTLKHKANQTKQHKIYEIIKTYRILSNTLSQVQWELFFMTGSFNRNHDIKHVQTPLSERYKQTCQYQVVGVLDSWLSNRKNNFKDMVYASHFDEETRIKLLYINKYNLYFKTQVTMKSEPIESEIIFLARKIIKHIFKKHRKPNLKHCNANLDAKVAIISSGSGQATHFDYWVKLSTLDKGKPIYIPLESNEYFENEKGSIRNFVQINEKNKYISIYLIKESPDFNKLTQEEQENRYIVKTEKLSLDLGLSTLFATNTGNLYGLNFLDKLKHYDRLITTLAKNRQRQKLKTRSKRYSNLINTLRSFLKNEVNRTLNRIILNHAPKEIVIEKLDFRNPNLSKKLNRIISNFGKSLITEKLESLKEEYGIIITEVNPAYTSQECSKCHYVDKRNRKTHCTFVCLSCHKKIHADINAARNHMSRSSSTLKGIWLSKAKILQMLLTEHLKRSSRRSSSAHVLMLNPYCTNPYYNKMRHEMKGFL